MGITFKDKDNNNKLLCYAALSPGDTFTYNGEPFLKIDVSSSDCSGIASVSLLTGKRHPFGCSYSVIKVNIKAEIVE